MVGSKVATLIGRPMVLGAEVFNERVLERLKSSDLLL